MHHVISGDNTSPVMLSNSTTGGLHRPIRRQVVKPTLIINQ